MNTQPSSLTSKQPTNSSPSEMMGHLPCFDPEKHDFDMWNKTFQNFLKANNLTTDNVTHQTRIISIFLSSLGIATYTLLCTILSPDDPLTKTLDQLWTTLHHHFKSLPKVLTERLQFQKRTQRQGESVQEFLTALSTLAVNCKFTDNLEERIRDQLIFGLSNECLQKKICEMHDNISLAKVVAMVTACETSLAQRSAFVRVVRQQPPPKISTSSTSSVSVVTQQPVQQGQVEPPCSNAPPGNYHRSLILRRRHHHQPRSSKKGSRPSRKRSSSEHSVLSS